MTDDLSGGEDGAGDSDDEPWSRTPLENALAVRAYQALTTTSTPLLLLVPCRMYLVRAVGSQVL